MVERSLRVLAAAVAVAILIWLNLLAAQRMTGGKLHLPMAVDAVESIWGVEVLKGKTLNRNGKRKRTRGTNPIGTTPGSKRAIVTLAAGEIPLFEN